MLTPAAVKAARPRAAAYKLYDERGLILHVLPGGGRKWRLRIRTGRSEQLLTLGELPDLQLVDARDRVDQVLARVAGGEEPRAAVAAVIAVDETRTFEAAARAWHEHQRAGWVPVHAAGVLAALERDIFPAIGAVELGTIRPALILKTLRAVEKRGSIETARRLQQNVERVFAFACSEGWTDTNPGAGVTESLALGRATRHQLAIVDAAELRALLAAVDGVAGAGKVVRRASRFLALTAVRMAAVRGATWGEIEDLDGPAPVWRVPAERMKLKAAKKLDAANAHVVPLSSAAVEILRAARADLHPGDANLHDGVLIFPGRGGEPIGKNAIGDLYGRAGYGDRHVPHGWRASFSTILNLRHPDQRGEIDRALAHAGGGGKEAKELGINVKVEGAYNRAQAALAPRRALFDAWAEILLG